MSWPGAAAVFLPLLPFASLSPAASSRFPAPKPPPPTAAAKGARSLPPAPIAATFPAGAAGPSSWWESATTEIVAAGRGRINYEASVVKAIGLGALAPPTLSRSRAQDALDARQAAIADALRTLAVAVSRVRVTATTRVENYLLKSDEVRLRVDGVVRSADVIEEKMLASSGIYRVVVQVPLTGAGSVSEAVGLGETDGASGEGGSSARRAQAPSPPPPDPFAPGAPAPPGATYTGLIVDCRGLGVVPCMSPRLFDAGGAELYGTMNVSPEYVIETGIAGFPRSMADARRAPRIGDRPLVVRAVGVADRNRFYPVVRDGDAQQVRAANEQDRFLERTAVVFVVDPL
jgi:hypothetical protein